MSNYWSSTTNANNSNNAWQVNFNNGNDNNRNKSSSYYVRAVRGGKCPLLSFSSLYAAYLHCRKRKRGTLNALRQRVKSALDLCFSFFAERKQSDRPGALHCALVNNPTSSARVGFISGDFTAEKSIILMNQAIFTSKSSPSGNKLACFNADYVILCSVVLRVLLPVS